MFFDHISITKSRTSWAGTCRLLVVYVPVFLREDTTYWFAWRVSDPPSSSSTNENISQESGNEPGGVRQTVANKTDFYFEGQRELLFC